MRKMLEIPAALAGLTMWAGLLYLFWGVTP